MSAHRCGHFGVAKFKYAIRDRILEISNLSFLLHLKATGSYDFRCRFLSVEEFHDRIIGALCKHSSTSRIYKPDLRSVVVVGAIGRERWPDKAGVNTYQNGANLTLTLTYCSGTAGTLTFSNS